MKETAPAVKDMLKPMYAAKQIDKVTTATKRPNLSLQHPAHRGGVL